MMMIVPLAGPDFDRPDGSTKAEILVEGTPLMRRALDGRAWRSSIARQDKVFVFRDTAVSRRFASETLSLWFPGARTVFLSHYSQGAAFSTLAGLSLAAMDEPVVVDLADIEFSCAPGLETRFADPNLGGIALTFPSNNPQYSYIQESSAGQFVRAAEKVVISEHASAGVYMFRDTATYLGALAHNLRSPADHTCNGLHYVCPLFNGVSAQGLRVERHQVQDVIDIKVD